MRHLLWLTLIVVASCVSAKPLETNNYRCVILYDLDGHGYQSMQRQIGQLRRHIISQSIALIDLRQMLDQAPHIPVSGRQVRMLRQEYDIPWQEQQGLTLDAEGKILLRQKQLVNLVDLMMACPTR